MANNTLRESTKVNYLNVWKNFNKFIILLDYIPETWEERTSLYCTFLTKHSEIQSSTIRSYVSAIKAKVSAIGYNWKDQEVKLASLVKGCKIKNDKVITRLPIKKNLLNLLNFELERDYLDGKTSNFTKLLYRTAFLLMYYGLMRIGEITQSEHVAKAKDVFLAENKSKLTIILYSSKTHDRSNRPQEIKIFPDKKTENFDPLTEINQYLHIRPPYRSENEQFLVFPDNTPILDIQVRSMLKRLLSKLNLNENNYNTHSFRIGRATDLQNEKISVDNIKKKGRWKSNAVYNYLR